MTNNRALIYGSTREPTKRISELVSIYLPSAVSVTSCRDSDVIKQTFLGLNAIFYPSFDRILSVNINSGNADAEEIEPVFHEQTHYRYKEPETYFLSQEDGSVKEFIDIDGKPYEVVQKMTGDIYDSNIYPGVILEDKIKRYDIFDKKYFEDKELLFLANILKTKSTPPDLVLIRKDGFVHWCNSECRSYNIDCLRQIKEYCKEYKTKLIFYDVQCRPDCKECKKSNNIREVRHEFSNNWVIKNEEEIISELKQIEEQFKKNLP